MCLGANLRDPRCSRACLGSRLRVILLHHAVAIPTNPQVALVIDEAAVGTMGQIRRETEVWIRWLNERWIAKPRNRVAIAIERNNRRRCYRRSRGVLTDNCARLITLLNAVESYTDLPTAIECVALSAGQRSCPLPLLAPMYEQRRW